MTFVDTRYVVPVSVTGPKCPMNCKHCGGVYLKHMIPVWSMERYAKESRKVFLISGGMSRNGEIPFGKWRDFLKRMKYEYGLKYNFHIGFPKEKEEIANELADVISADFFADPDVMEEVYGIRRDPLEQLELLKSYDVPVVPHVTIGIRCGEITHELRAIEFLSKAFRSLVLNVFIPTPGTFYERCSPPDVKEVVKLFGIARRFFDVVFLGCMQPRGTYRLELQKRLLNLVDGITKPVLNGKRSYNCCAFEVLKKHRR